MEIHSEVISKSIQESSDMLIGEGYDLQSPTNIPGFRQTTNFRPNYASPAMEQKMQKNLMTYLRRY